LVKRHIMDYLYIAGTILFTVYGQVIVKWQVSQIGAVPPDMEGRLAFLFRLLFNPWIISSLTAAFLAFLCWAGALSKFELSYAYPFTSLSFVLVFLLSVLLFQEAVTPLKLAGLAFVVLGIFVGSRG
jgi:multidrug transporter EmrE-like cation transporter